LTLPVCVAHAPSEASRAKARASLIGRDILFNNQDAFSAKKFFR